MTEEQFAAYKAWMVEDYAQEIAKNYRLSINIALAGAASDVDRQLSQGLATPNHFFYNIVLLTESGESCIGSLWFDVDDQMQRCWLGDIYLQAEFRHQGWGSKTLDLLETDMRQRGITSISLHVFAANRIAQAFYGKMGYHPTGINMQKWLSE
jgi:ribosomal protein S18 acetylase RimI-like enzyme